MFPLIYKIRSEPRRLLQLQGDAEAVVLDGTNRARLLQTRLHRERSGVRWDAEQPNPMRDFLRDAEQRDHQQQSEKHVMSSFFKGYYDSKPDCCRHQNSTGADLTAELGGYHATTAWILANIEDTWQSSVSGASYVPASSESFSGAGWAD